jgi:hypothetical protein
MRVERIAIAAAGVDRRSVGGQRVAGLRPATPESEGGSRTASSAWMLEVPVRELPRTPNALAWVDVGVQSLTTAGLTGEDQLGVLLLLDGHARNAGA